MKDFNLQEQGNINFLNEKGISFCLVQLTENILSKSIFDATTQIRAFLKKEGIHDFSLQKNGQDDKLLINTYILTFARVIKTETSLYRAGTRGDERMWFGSPILTVTKPADLYAIFEKEHEIYLINISKINIESLWKSSVPNPVGEFITYKIAKPTSSKTIQLTITEVKSANDEVAKPNTETPKPVVATPVEHPNDPIESQRIGFVKYLRAKGMADHSVKKYSSYAPNNSDIKEIINREFGLPSLYAIQNSEQARKIYKIVCKAKFNKEGHNMYSVAIHHYCKFIESAQVAGDLFSHGDTPKDDTSVPQTPQNQQHEALTHETYITVTEAADIAGVTSETIRNLCKAGVIGYESKSHYYFPKKEDVINYRRKIMQVHTISTDIERLKDQLEDERKNIREAIEENKKYLEDIKITPYRLQKIAELVHALLQQYQTCNIEEIQEREIELMLMLSRGVSMPETAEKMKLTRARIAQIWIQLLRKLASIKSEIKKRDEEIESLRAIIQDLTKSPVDCTLDSVTQVWLQNIEVLLLPIESLHFSIRTEHGLQAFGIKTVLDLVQYQRKALKGARNFGEKSLTEIDNWLEAHHLDYGMVLPPNLNIDQLRNYLEAQKIGNEETPELPSEPAAIEETIPNNANLITPNNINHLEENEVFVFGSNLSGIHGGGAARVAFEKFGAQWGVGEGPTGKCYAIPTMQGGVDTIKPYVDKFIEYAKQHTEQTFLVTRIGCGIAGFTDEQIAPLFAAARNLPNVALPEGWREL